MSNRVVAVVPAAGRGARMGGNIPKQFLSLGDIPILVYALRTLESVQSITDIIVVIPQADQAFCREDIIQRYGIRKVTDIVAGGLRRQDSVRNGVMAITETPALVVVHDGVRPFVSKEIVMNAVQVAMESGAALVAIPMKDTVKRVNQEGYVEDTLNREDLWLAQTPQVFRYSWLREAHELAEAQDLEVTDDAGLIEQLGYPISIVEGSAHNIKITRPEDLALGEAILACQKLEGGE